jgi:tetratricopeptide (TPR) repeat protein
MARIGRVVLVWALAAAMAPACHGGQEDSGTAAPDLAALARRARPAVGVLVTFNRKGETLSRGTAFLVLPDGVALTCHHVLSGAASALLRMEDGAFLPVEGTLAADQARDLALLKVTGNDLPTVSLGDSSTLAPGQRVVAITAPEGLGNTVADGLVSAMRELPSGSVMQVTILLSSGSSGGPVFDLSGRVVAVAAAVLTDGQALNFAIPINAAKPLLAQPGRLTPLAPAAQPADLEDWLRERPPSPAGDSAYYLWLKAMDAHLKRRDQEALEHLRAALALDPSLYQAHCCLGWSYGTLGRYEEAVAAIKEAVRLKPDDARAYWLLGLAYDDLGHWQEELEAYQQAIRLKPDYAEAYYDLGVAYGDLGRWQEAAEAYKQAIRVRPDYVEARCNLGIAYARLGLRKEELEAYQQAINLKRDEARVHRNFGFAYGQLGRWQEAVDAYKQAIRVKPDYAEVYYLLGLVYARLGRSQEELEAYKEAIRVKPDYAEAYYDLGVAYDHLGRREEALEAFKQAIRLKPDYAEAHYGLGLAYGSLGRWQEAVEALKQAVRLKSDYADAHCNLGVAYLKLGHRDAALEQYRILQKLDPGLAAKLFVLINP